MVKAGLVDGIVVASLSRLSRSMADLSALIRDHFQPRKGRRASAALISVGEAFDTGTPAGRAMAQLLGVFAELEREMTSARCYKSAMHNRAQGRCVGSAPYGWRATGELGDKQRGARAVPGRAGVCRDRQAPAGWRRLDVAGDLRRAQRPRLPSPRRRAVHAESDRPHGAFA